MATVVLPNTFVASTVASASEVNDNFTAITTQVNGNLEAANLATDAVTTSKIATGAVTTAKIADANVTTVKILDANVTNDKVAAGLDAAKLTVGTLPIARIADGSVTVAKLDSAVFASGTFTPTLSESFDGTIAVAEGHYTKIGSLVNFSIYLEVDETSAQAAMSASTNLFSIRGLPFVPLASRNYTCAFGAKGVRFAIANTSGVENFSTYHGTIRANAGVGELYVTSINRTETTYYDGDALFYNEIFLSGDGTTYFSFSGSYVAAT